MDKNRMQQQLNPKQLQVPSFMHPGTERDFGATPEFWPPEQKRSFVRFKAPLSML